MFVGKMLRLPLPDEVLVAHPKLMHLVERSSKPQGFKFVAGEKVVQIPPKIFRPSEYGFGLLGPAVKVWAFFRRFDEYLHAPEFSLDELILCASGHSPEILTLANDIYTSLALVAIEEFKGLDRKDPDRANQHASYMLSNKKDDFLLTHLRGCWPEIYAGLSSMGKFSTPPDVQNTIQLICNLGVNQLHTVDPIARIRVLSWAVECIYEFTSFRSCFSKVMEQQSEFGKQRTTLAESLKGLISDKRKLVEELQQVESSIQTSEAECSAKEQNEDADRREVSGMKSKISQQRKKLESLTAKNTKLANQIAGLQKEVDELAIKSNFWVHPVKLLGRDRVRRKYFFVGDYPSKVFIEQGDEQNSLQSVEIFGDWTTIDTSEDLQTLINSLCRYSQRESRLREGLEELVLNGYFRPVQSQETSTQRLTRCLEELGTYITMFKPSEQRKRMSTRAVTNQHTRADPMESNVLLRYFRERVLGSEFEQRTQLDWLATLVLDLEREFSNFMQFLCCEWAHRDTRQQMRKALREQPTIENLQQFILRVDDGAKHALRYKPMIKIDKSKGIQWEEDADGTRQQSSEGGSDEEEGESNDEQSESEEEARPRRRMNGLTNGSRIQAESKQSIGNVSKNTIYTSLLADPDRDWAQDGFIQSGKTCLYPFGFYNEWTRQAWKKLAAEKRTATAGYLCTVFMVEAFCSYVGGKLRRIEEDDFNGNPCPFREYLEATYQPMLSVAMNKKNKETVAPLSRKERASNRQKLSERFNTDFTN